jgi:glycerophosphoryl diester phosphodiesterase
VEKNVSTIDKLPLVIAHRGASIEAPENTLASFQLAFQQGVKAIEGDFRVTADGHIVCIHDANGRRTLGNPAPVSKSTLSKLKQFSAGKWKGEKWVEEKIPTLEEVIEIMPPGTELYLEVKCGMEIIEPLTRIIESRNIAPDQLSLISYDPSVLKAFKNRFHNFFAYLIVKFEREFYLLGSPKPDFEKVIETLREYRLDGLDSKAQSIIDPSFVEKLNHAGYPLLVWTVNDAETADYFIQMGVEAITTDRPQWLMQHLEENYSVN